MKKELTIIVPTYKADKYLKKNIETWKEISKLYDVKIIEDGTHESEGTAILMGAEYYNKKNGNWGSVINYSKKLKIDSEYTMIVDADDKIKTKELQSILSNSNNEDVILTGVDDVNYNTEKSKTRFAKLNNPKNTFIHTIIFKTEIFKKIRTVKEGIPHQDHHVVFDVISQAKTFKEFKISPYIYYYNIPGQSISSIPKNYGEIVSTYKNLIGNNITTKYIEAFTTASIIWYTKNKIERIEMLKKYKNIGKTKYMPYFWLKFISIFKKQI